jgi:hypothetical protein
MRGENSIREVIDIGRTRAKSKIPDSPRQDQDVDDEIPHHQFVADSAQPNGANKVDWAIEQLLSEFVLKTVRFSCNPFQINDEGSLVISVLPCLCERSAGS